MSVHFLCHFFPFYVETIAGIKSFGVDVYVCRSSVFLAVMPLLNQYLLFLVPIVSFVSAQSDLLNEANPIFIRFNGSLSAHYTPPPSLSSQCHEFSIVPLRASTVYVGMYPDWDLNPFFFHISHGHSEDCSPADCPWDYYDTGSHSRARSLSHSSWSSLPSPTPNDNEKRQFFYTTYDQLYGLNFASTYYVCQKDGRDCDTVEVDPYYVSAQMLDLSRASVSQVEIGDEKGYRVQGDEKTWVSNGTTELSFYMGEDHVPYNNAPATTCLEQQ